MEMPIILYIYMEKKDHRWLYTNYICFVTFKLFLRDFLFVCMCYLPLPFDWWKLIVRYVNLLCDGVFDISCVSHSLYIYIYIVCKYVNCQ